MKLKHILLLSIFVITGTAEATRFFALNHEKDKKTYHNELVELDSQSGEVMTKIKLRSTNRFATEKLNLPLSDYMFFYGKEDKKTGQLEIVNKTDLDDIKSVKIDAINSYLVPNVGMQEFKHLTADNQFLILHTGYKKEQNITIIDVTSGSIAKQIPISKHRNTVELSSDGNYLLVNNISKDELTVISLDQFNVVMTSNLGKFRAYATINNDHLYLTKYTGKPPKKSYWIQALNLVTKEKTNFTAKGKTEPVFAVGEDSGQLMVVTTSEDGKQTFLSRVTGSQTEIIGTYEMKMRPEKMFINEEFNQALIKGKGQIATVQLQNPAVYSVTKLPFDSIMYGYNDSGKLLYLKEGTGSEVAVIDVESGELIERSGTGRPGVKFGQFMASVALAGVGLNYGYGIYFARYSNTGFTLNHDQDKLYVINTKTNDVTHFNAHDLSDRKAIATGNLTFLVHHGNATDAPLWVFSTKHINQINDQNFTLEKEIEYEDIIGFDMEADYFIIKTTEDIQTYDMKTGDISNQWPLVDVDEVWTES
ncbi:hypothetical protein OS175_03845 [Marinicella sp. S1101]|uniref:YncE family protein n=1 Tax=Marinicella marina TaxID=2996016 RepID=UPI002260DFD1|nr:hypothetical protein [Marinicella marina]MCX7553000.1 hypothetical protein [Marinicella marina]MDJ1139690.1 hypothetical protein [Marinicella marina]